MVARWEIGWGHGQKRKSEGIKKYKSVVTELSWGCKVQHRKWTWTTVWELPEGVGKRLGGGGKWGKNWANRNSIINKIYLEKHIS